MKMNAVQHRRAADLFGRAVNLAEKDRSRFLDKECGADAEMRGKLNQLLLADSPGDKLFGTPLKGVVVPTTIRSNTLGGKEDVNGQRIGHYTLRRLIASGGMGRVYEAEQENPRRVVAVKLMKRGVPSSSAQRRFEFEAEILGRLRHPGIAQIYEAGSHGEGEDRVPFFAMEYVPGARTITDYASAKRLGTSARLELFARVCDAVSSGHDRGIIHRDLKPSNILVDSNGNPKVIDFGVARFTDRDIVAASVRTDIGQLVGTVQYMSPEQSEADDNTLDVRSDVYSLGVVLYELLCDRPPYDVEPSMLHHAVRIIREANPARPGSVNRMLRGDIETIALKALEKDRDRRYRSAAEMADDIRRYLRREPISARPPSFSYQARMFARRHRAPVIAGLLLFAMLIGFGASMAVLCERAVVEQRRADYEREQLCADRRESDEVWRFVRQAGQIVLAADQSNVQRGAAFDRILGLAKEQLGNNPACFASTMMALAKPSKAGSVTPAPDDDTRKRLVLEAARALLQEQQPHARRVQLFRDVTKELLGAGEWAMAEALVAKAQGIQGRTPDQTAVLLQLSAELTDGRGDDVGALALSNQAFALMPRTGIQAGGAWPQVLRDREAFLRRRGAPVLDTLRANVDLHRRLLAPHTLSLAESLARLGQALLQAGLFDEAKAVLREAHALNVEIYGDDRWQPVQNAAELLDRATRGDRVIIPVKTKPASEAPGASVGKPVRAGVGS